MVLVTSVATLPAYKWWLVFVIRISTQFSLLLRNSEVTVWPSSVYNGMPSLNHKPFDVLLLLIWLLPSEYIGIYLI